MISCGRDGVPSAVGALGWMLAVPASYGEAYEADCLPYEDC